MENTETKFPYVVEVTDNVCYNEDTGEIDNDTPVYVTNETLRFARWEEAVAYFYQWRIRRDFCYGHNFLEDSKTVNRFEIDEGGYTEYTLHKWPGFEECRKVRYIVDKDNTKKEFGSYDAMLEWIHDEFGPKGYIYWKDDSAGRLGWVRDTNGEETDWTVFNYSEFIETEYFKERNEKVKKRVAEDFKKEFEEEEEEGSEEDKDLVGLPF